MAKEVLNEEVVNDVPKEETLKGRAATYAAYRQAHPDAGEELNDDEVDDWRNGSYSELEGKFNNLENASKTLGELFMKDPKIAAFFTRLLNGESPEYAIAREFGKEWSELDDEGLEEANKGYKERLDELSRLKSQRDEVIKNIDEKYIPALQKYVKGNGLKEEDAKRLNDAIFQNVEDTLSGVISSEFIDFVWKGLNYEQDVQEAAETGKIEARNSIIETKKAQKQTPPLPDASTKSATARRRQRDVAPMLGGGSTDGGFLSKLKDVDK
jgi:hypothetical protein